MTGGLITASAHNISLLDCFIGLVDLETGEMLWTNSLRLGQNPANEGLYKGAWSRALLFHLPDRTHQKSSCSDPERLPVLPNELGKALAFLYRERCSRRRTFRTPRTPRTAQFGNSFFRFARRLELGEVLSK